MFIAAGIFDRYINSIGPENFERKHAVHLATTSILLAAKIAEPMSPSFTRMIKLLSDIEKHNVDKAGLI